MNKNVVSHMIGQLSSREPIFGLLQSVCDIFVTSGIGEGGIATNVGNAATLFQSTRQLLRWGDGIMCWGRIKNHLKSKNYEALFSDVVLMFLIALDHTDMLASNKIINLNPQTKARIGRWTTLFWLFTLILGITKTNKDIANISKDLSTPESKQRLKELKYGRIMTAVDIYPAAFYSSFPVIASLTANSPASAMLAHMMRAYACILQLQSQIKGIK